MFARLQSLVVLSALAACGDDARGADRCELGTQLWQQKVAALAMTSASCTSDADCMLLDTSIACQGVSISLCGTVTNRSTAAQWDAGALCQEIEAESASSSTACSSQAACVAVRPACVNALCTGVE